MSEQERALAAGVALLERAIDYTLGSLRIVTPQALCRPTPCAGWNLQRLLDHLGDSLRTLNEAATGHIPPSPVRPGGTTALLLRDGATEVLGRWVATVTAGPIAVGDRHLTAPMVAAVGAIEIAVHGWDVARACGEPRPIPPLMAAELLDLARLFVTPHDRAGRFGPALPVPACALPQDQLLAHLGRHPNWLFCN